MKRPIWSGLADDLVYGRIDPLKIDVAGKQQVVLRKDLDELVFTGRSHMPEGLYGKMNLQQMADLFAFLSGREPPPRQFAGNQPQQVVRGPDTAFTMPASTAANQVGEATYPGWAAK